MSAVRDRPATARRTCVVTPLDQGGNRSALPTEPIDELSPQGCARELASTPKRLGHELLEVLDPYRRCGSIRSDCPQEADVICV